MARLKKSGCHLPWADYLDVTNLTDIAHVLFGFKICVPGYMEIKQVCSGSSIQWNFLLAGCFDIVHGTHDKIICDATLVSLKYCKFQMFCSITLVVNL